MKKFKKIDLGISTILIIYFIVFNVITVPDSLIDEHILIGYFVVGGWQVVSMLVHALTRTFAHKRGKRYIYHWVTFIALATMPAGSFWILAFTAPFMAIFYTWLCFDEVRKMNQRPLAILK